MSVLLARAGILAKQTVGGGGGGGLDPDDVTGLIGWWKADSLALANNDPVATWTDSSSGGHNATEATIRPTFKTAVQNSLPGLLFDQDQLLSNLSQATKPFTFAGVIKPVSIGTYQGVFGASTPGGWEVRINPSGQFELMRQAQALVATSTDTVSANTAALVVVTYSGAGVYEFRVDGVSAGSGTSDHTPTAATTVLGSNATGSETLDGYLFEAAWWDNVLAGGDLTGVEDGLSAKWATP